MGSRDPAAAERARISFRWAFAAPAAGVGALAAELAGGLGSQRPDEDVAWWARALDRQCRDHLTTLNLLAPWLLLPPDDVRRGAAVEERLGRARSRPCARWRVSVWRLRPPTGPGEGDGCAKLRETIAAASARAAERITAIVEALAPLRRARGSESPVPVRPVAPPAGDRVQRR